MTSPGMGFWLGSQCQLWIPSCGTSFKSISSFLRNFQTDFRSGGTNLHSYQQGTIVPLCHIHAIIFSHLHSWWWLFWLGYDAIFFLKIIFILLYVFCLHVCLHSMLIRCLWGQSDPLDLEIQESVSCSVGAENQSQVSERAAGTLSHWAFFRVRWKTKFYCYTNGPVIPALDWGRMRGDFFVRYDSGAWKMSQGVRYLLCKHGDPNSDSQNPCKVRCDSTHL